MLEFDAVKITKGDFTLTAHCMVAPGSRVAVIGPSGAGKSTMIGAIAGFEPLTTGRLLWHGADISGLGPGQRPAATLFQDQNLFPHLSVLQNVGLGLNPNLRLSAADRDRVHAALARVALSGLENRRPAELSGGQQSRAALARITLQAKDILLLDEPFAALGPALKADMLDLVAELCAETGATLLMVSHNPDDARRICPQTILVADGVAVAPMDTQTLLDDPPSSLQDYLGTS